MADYVWPDDLVPYAMSFYLQAHTGGAENPFSRKLKVYGLSAPRWVCSMTFRGGYAGTRGAAAFGPRLDAFLAKLKGRENRVRIYDFRRPYMRARTWRPAAGNNSAAKGATSMVLTGLPPSTKVVMAGDYVGGDGRPHIVTDDATSNLSGNATVSFQPPLASNVPANAAVFGKPTGLFRLISDDAAMNGVAVGEAVEMTLEFVEDL